MHIKNSKWINYALPSNFTNLNLSNPQEKKIVPVACTNYSGKIIEVNNRQPFFARSKDAKQK